MIKAILFDWHGVLDKVSLEGLFRLLSRDTKFPIDELKIKLEGDARQFALGYFTGDDFWTHVRRQTDATPKQMTKIKDYINSITPNKELWKFLKILRKSFKLAIFSDCPLEKTKKIRRTLNLNIFDEIFFSSEVQLDKKMLEFFELAVNKLGLGNEEVLFVDDSQKNVEFASELKFQVYKFTTTKNFKKMIIKKI